MKIKTIHSQGMNMVHRNKPSSRQSLGDCLTAAGHEIPQGRPQTAEQKLARLKWLASNQREFMRPIEAGTSREPIGYCASVLRTLHAAILEDEGT